MAMPIKMHFSISYRTSDITTELGSIKETDWSVEPVLSNSGKSWVAVKIFRSRCNSRENIDVRVYSGEDSLISINGFLLKEDVSNTGALTFSSNVLFNLVNTLTGYVIIHYNSPSTLSGKMELATQTENHISPSHQLVNDLLHLLNNPESFSDATLVCSTAKIPVHRGILSARSPVFAAMFKTQMQEGRDGIVDIVDIEPDVIWAMLKYIYSGKTDHLTHSLAEDLLFVADKYQLEELKLICIEELKVSMTSHNVFRSLVLGDLHDQNLKTHAVEFICKCTNFSDLEKSEEWQTLLKEHPYLAVEVLTTVVKCLQKK